MDDLYIDYVNVLVVVDGIMFSFECEYKCGGFFVGEKGDEIKVDLFDEVLKYLISMFYVKWCWFNNVGNYGLVSVVEWCWVKWSEVIS